MTGWLQGQPSIRVCLLVFTLLLGVPRVPASAERMPSMTRPGSERSQCTQPYKISSKGAKGTWNSDGTCSGYPEDACLSF